MKERGQGYLGAIITFAILAVLIVIVGWLGWFRTVDQGETCVVTRLGKVVDVAPVGVSWAFRGTHKYSCYPSRAIMYQAAQDAIGDADYVDYPIGANTSDGQKVEITANVSFHIDPENVMEVYTVVGRNMNEVKTRIIANHTRSTIRNIVPSYQALDLYTSGRVQMEAEVREALGATFSEYGVTLDDFRLRSIIFDADYAQVLEDKQVALERVRVKEYEAQQAEFEADRAAELARGQADAVIEKARGDAEARVVNAKAEAEAITLKGQALQANPEILSLEFIQNLSTSQWLAIPWENLEPFIPLDVPQGE